MSFPANSAFNREDLEKRVDRAQQEAETLRDKQATFRDEENQPYRLEQDSPTAEGPTPGELESWYLTLNSIVIDGVREGHWQELEELRDQIYRFLR